MPFDPFEQDVDDLLADLHRIIDDEQPDSGETLYTGDLDIDLGPLLDARVPDTGPDLLPSAPPQTPPSPTQPAHWSQTQKLPRHVAKLQRNQAQAYSEWLYAQDEQPAERAAHWSQTQKQPKHVAKLQQHQQEAYAQWLDEQEPARPNVRPAATYEELPDYDMEPPKKQRHGFRNFVLILLALALIMMAVVVFLLPKQPAAVHDDLRKPGISTILLAGTDQDGMRTDTLMLLTMDRPGKRISLVSIPRDTLVNGSYAVPKINSVYGANRGGDAGIEMLLTRVAECVGFRPDGYMLIRLEAFVELVDTLGGVTFDVPVDMYHNDPAQDLFIDLKAGSKTLTGEEAMGVVRFRSGYADADLGRVQVQRDFLSALLKQAVTPESIANSPLLLQILLDNTATDLTASHFLWLAESLVFCDRSNIETATLPGSARTLNGGSYYVLDPEAVAQTVNTYCNPYEDEITVADLEIRNS